MENSWSATILATIGVVSEQGSSVHAVTQSFLIIELKTAMRFQKTDVPIIYLYVMHCLSAIAKISVME
jgi:hypothetical protein